MKRLLIVCCLSGIFGYSFGQKPVSAKPNVIIILMDDMGYGDTEPYGMTGIPTPNFNKLAAEGMRFTHYNAGQPICTASRAALLTGCYPNRVGMSGALLPGSKIALDPNEQTLASLLKGVGYKTAMLGKWHLGNRAPYFPLHYGFDSWYGLPYSHDIWPRDQDGNKITDPDNARYTWPELTMLDGDRVVDTIRTHEQQEQFTTLFTEKAVSFIKSNKTHPFFLYLAQPMPHVPLAVSAKFKGKSGMGLFGDVIMELDWSLGQIMATLETTGLSKNTILIVASDNGPWLNFGNHAGSSGGFREGKATTFEGGTRVPLLLRWPGKIPAASVNSHLMTNMDLLPTIAAATGAALPRRKIDGLNFLPSLTSAASPSPREVFYYYFGKNNLEGIRYKNWKLVLPHTSSSYTALHGKDGKGGKIPHIPVPMGLYDLAHDPGEAYDVQQLYPEMVQQLLKIADQAREELGDDLTGHEGKERRKAATVLPVTKPYVESWITDPDQSIFFQQRPPLNIEKAEAGDGGLSPVKQAASAPAIRIDPGQTYQSIDGFGFCLTGGSAQLMMRMTPAKRAALIKELFATDGKNIGISYLRVSIGASDLNEYVFSYDDLADSTQTDLPLARFDLGPDKKDVIPVLKKILAVNPSIKILGSPWSAPTWMKTNHDTRGGSLKPEYFEVYAQYLAKYIESMKAEGITIDAITVQNEPLHPGNNPSMFMPATDQAMFIKTGLGPVFSTHHLATKIIVYDHNCDKPEYPISILNDPEARKYVNGSAFHLYGGEISALTTVHDAYPDKALYFTEQWLGAPGNFKQDIKEHITKLTIGATRNWSRTVLEWNLAADPHSNPHTDRGGCDRCLGGITIDQDSVTRNPAYYIVAQAAKFVRPGSVRIASNLPESLPNVAFKTPEDGVVLIVINTSDRARSFMVDCSGQQVSLHLNGGAVGTYVWH